MNAVAVARTEPSIGEMSLAIAKVFHSAFCPTAECEAGWRKIAKMFKDVDSRTAYFHITIGNNKLVMTNYDDRGRQLVSATRSFDRPKGKHPARTLTANQILDLERAMFHLTQHEHLRKIEMHTLLEVHLPNVVDEMNLSIAMSECGRRRFRVERNPKFDPAIFRKI